MSNIQLTFTQCKQLVNNGVDLRGFVEQINDQPEFLHFMGKIDSISELHAILQGGCASGAYMPAVTYHTANKCMAECSDSIEEQIADSFEEGIVFNPSTDSWYQFASTLVSAAVESWCYQFNSALEGVDWD